VGVALSVLPGAVAAQRARLHRLERALTTGKGKSRKTSMHQQSERMKNV
jgi:hypothetical protein